MFEVGLLILRGTRTLIEQQLKGLLREATANVQKRLYVKIDLDDFSVSSQKDFEDLVPIVYSNASKIAPDMDLRVLLNRQQQLIVDQIFPNPNSDLNSLSFPLKEFEEHGNKYWKIDFNRKNDYKKKYNHVVLGGTFDRIHNGHKLLLSTAILLSNKILTCGITDGEMNKNKILWEMITPVEDRCRDVVEFVRDVSEGIECRAVPINDPYGPSIVEADMDCIVVSQETAAGGESVNRKREERGLSTLKIEMIPLLEENEIKLSSTNKRRREHEKHL